VSASTAIVGIGQSAIGDLPGRTSLSLLGEACGAALADAGLTLGDVDGLFVAPARAERWFSPSITVAQALSLTPAELATIDVAGASGAAVVVHASAAVASGRCTTALCVAGQALRSRMRAGHSEEADTFHPSLEAPYGPSVPSAYAMLAQRHMHLYGTTERQLACIAVAARQFARMNELAHKREPLDIETAMSAEYVATPLRRYDCSLISDGAAAFVVTTAERARDLPRGGGVALLGHGLSLVPDPMAIFDVPLLASGRDAFQRAGLRPSDVDVAELYDCFTIAVLLELEGLGICAPGESGHYVEEVGLGLESPVPVNTHGGLLSAGHPGLPGGFFHVLEAVRQIRGDATARLKADVNVALVHGNGGVYDVHCTLLLGPLN
jgi:acetyl-CoA acetyltransferase